MRRSAMTLKSFAPLLSILATLALPAAAVDLFTPGLPASPEQSLSCRILNTTPATQVVTVQALDSDGAVVAASQNQALSPGQVGGFAVSGRGGAMYCRFRVT